MHKKFTILAALTVATISNPAFAGNMPASMQSQYQNKFNWYEQVQYEDVQAPQQQQAQVIEQPAIQPQMEVQQEQPMVEAVAPSRADDNGVSAAVKFGSMGIGLEGEKMYSDNVGVRAGVNYSSASTSDNVDDVAYTADADWFTGDMLVDYYPITDNGLRVSTGFYVGDQNIEMTATPTANVNIGGTSYTTGDVGTINADIETPAITPYLGVGYSSKERELDGWNAGVDLGVKYNGDPDVNLRTTGTGVSAADLRAEEGNIADDLTLMKFYPVATISIGYKF